jgi:glycosyltransferase involved in cell wall biosynthesis
MGNKPKILIFIDWYKPGFKAGGPIRSISNLVDYFSDKLDFYIVTSNTDYLEETPYNSVNSDQWNKVDKSTVYYLSNNNTNYKNIKNLITEVNPSTVYCNSLYSLHYSLLPIYISKKLNIRTILAVRGMLSEGSLGVKSSKKKIFLVLAKTIGLFNKCLFHATNSSEQKDIKNTFGENTPTTIAQNLPELKQLSFKPKQKEANSLRLVSIGRVAPEKNTLYALEALKNVQEQIIFDIYGPIYSNEYWNKCKTAINQLPENIVVNYKGVLNHQKINQTLENYHALFLPSTGENFGHIIIEAMINSCTPLISDKTPWLGLEAKNIGYDLSLNNKALFSETIDKLALMDENTLNILTKNAHQYAVDIINDKKLIVDYYKLFNLTNLDG